MQVSEEYGLDEPLLHILPLLIKSLDLYHETAVAVTWNKKKNDYDYHWYKGDIDEVEFPPKVVEKSLILVHTHPGTPSKPPSPMDIGACILNWARHGQWAPNYYVVDVAGVWRVNKLTADAQKELDEMVANNPEWPHPKAEAHSDGDDGFWQIAIENANDNWVRFVEGVWTRAEYLQGMLQLWNEDMGIEIDFIPWSEFK